MGQKYLGRFRCLILKLFSKQKRPRKGSFLFQPIDNTHIVTLALLWRFTAIFNGSQKIKIRALVCLHHRVKK